MKKLIVLLAVFALAFAAVTPAFTAGQGPGKGQGSQKGPRGTFAMTGYITAIGSNTVTIQVYRGNNLVKPYIGQTLTVTVTSSTRYIFKNGTTSTPIKFTDLKVGDPVSANGTVANGVWTAKRITVGASLSCLP
jgi:hypothetical protein